MLTKSFPSKADRNLLHSKKFLPIVLGDITVTLQSQTGDIEIDKNNAYLIPLVDKSLKVLNDPQQKEHLTPYSDGVVSIPTTDSCFNRQEKKLILLCQSSVKPKSSVVEKFFELMKTNDKVLFTAGEGVSQYATIRVKDKKIKKDLRNIRKEELLDLYSFSSSLGFKENVQFNRAIGQRVAENMIGFSEDEKNKYCTNYSSKDICRLIHHPIEDYKAIEIDFSDGKKVVEVPYYIARLSEFFKGQMEAFDGDGDITSVIELFDADTFNQSFELLGDAVKLAVDKKCYSSVSACDNLFIQYRDNLVTSFSSKTVDQLISIIKCLSFLDIQIPENYYGDRFILHSEPPYVSYEYFSDEQKDNLKFAINLIDSFLYKKLLDEAMQDNQGVAIQSMRLNLPTEIISRMYNVFKDEHSFCHYKHFMEKEFQYFWVPKSTDTESFEENAIENPAQSWLSSMNNVYADAINNISQKIKDYKKQLIFGAKVGATAIGIAALYKYLYKK